MLANLPVCLIACRSGCQAVRWITFSCPVILLRTEYAFSGKANNTTHIPKDYMKKCVQVAAAAADKQCIRANHDLTLLLVFCQYGQLSALRVCTPGMQCLQQIFSERAFLDANTEIYFRHCHNSSSSSRPAMQCRK